MTLVLATQAGENAVILAADSRGMTLGSSGEFVPYRLPVRELFARNGCGILTFGGRTSVPETIAAKLPSAAGLLEAVGFMEREFLVREGVHAIVAGLDAGDPQIWHVHKGDRYRLASPLGQPNMLYFNQGDQIEKIYPQASEDHGVIISQMLGMLRERTDSSSIGPPFTVLVISE